MRYSNSSVVMVFLAAVAAAAAVTGPALAAGAAAPQPAKAATTPSAAAPQASAPAQAVPLADAGDLYARIAAAYMNGDWDALEKALAAPPKDLARLTKEQQTDVAYVRQAMAECRPPWWKQCKTVQKAAIRPAVWGQALNVAADLSSGKGSMQLKNEGGQLVAYVSWNAADFDSAAPGEYGFLKGDLTNLGVWSTLGSVAAWASMPPMPAGTVSEKDNLRLNLYLNFRGNVTGLYYGSPVARRWGLHIYLAAYMPEYGKGPMATPRKAAAAMFLAEVLKAPARYPSLALPESLAAEGAEEKLAVHYKFKISRKAVWTIAEDKAFREAVKTFASANNLAVYQAGIVSLPNGLKYGLLPDEDSAFRAKRDAWVKAQFDKARAQQ